MDKSDKSDFSVGYKKPPRHTQFKPGQSGNPKGRPRQPTTIADVVAKQLRKRVTVTMGGKAETVPMLHAIAMKLVSQAANGDHKSTAMVLGALNASESDPNNKLPELLQQFREIHASHVVADRRRSRPTGSIKAPQATIKR